MCGGPVWIHHKAPKINTCTYTPELHSKLQAAQAICIWLQNVINSKISSVQTGEYIIIYFFGGAGAQGLGVKKCSGLESKLFGFKPQKPKANNATVGD